MMLQLLVSLSMIVHVSKSFCNRRSRQAHSDLPLLTIAYVPASDIKTTPCAHPSQQQVMPSNLLLHPSRLPLVASRGLAILLMVSAALLAGVCVIGQ